MPRMGSIQDGSVHGHEVAAWETALHPDQVEHNLFISSGFTEAELDVLQMHGISHILQVGYELQPHHPGVFQYTQLDLADSFDADIVQYLPAAFTFIINGMQHGKVLVHCVHGQSRSVAVVVAFLMWRDGKPYRECLELLKAARPRAAPNAGFELQLCLLQDIGFDFSKWPGWNETTFITVRQMLLREQGHEQRQQQQQQPPQQRAQGWVGCLLPAKQQPALCQQEPQSGTIYEDVSIGRSRRPSAELRELQRQIEQELQHSPMLPQPAALQWCQPAPQHQHQYEQHVEQQLQAAASDDDQRHGAEIHIEVGGVDDSSVTDVKAVHGRSGQGCCVMM